jgi:hypothetical protein
MAIRIRPGNPGCPAFLFKAGKKKLKKHLISREPKGFRVSFASSARNI